MKAIPKLNSNALAGKSFRATLFESGQYSLVQSIDYKHGFGTAFHVCHFYLFNGETLLSAHDRLQDAINAWNEESERAEDPQ